MGVTLMSVLGTVALPCSTEPPVSKCKARQKTQKMLQRSARRFAGIIDFVDSAFIKNKRPRIPGGAWPVEALRLKSTSDLQQIWFLLLRERNMLTTMREHYLRHTEELGAWPAPSRLRMVEDSMRHIRTVVRERDDAATDKALQMFRDRIKRGIYRFPPGPQPPPGHNATSSTVVVRLSQYVEKDRLAAIFGRFDRFEAHKGIVDIQLRLPPDVLEQKRLAEEAFEAWRWSFSDYDQYYSWPGTPAAARKNDGGAGDDGQPSVSFFDDSVEVELAPGEFLGFRAQGEAKSSAATTNAASSSSSALMLEATGDDVVVAAALPVPAPLTEPPLPTDALQRLKLADRGYEERHLSQFPCYPDITMQAPPKPAARPTHPDEIHGPWEAVITYEGADGVDYVNGLRITAIDGAHVLSVSGGEPTDATEPFAERCPIYQEVLRREEADIAHQKQWPATPAWNPKWFEFNSKSRITSIISHNWANVLDYVEREALLTSKSIWELPIEVDPFCGNTAVLPPGTEPPEPALIKQPTL